MLKTVGNPSTRYGDQTIVDGSLVIGTAGEGIDFSANGGNVLTQYDEGTWTATLTGSGGAPTTPVTVTGTYTQIGRQVTVQAYFENVDTTGASGDIIVNGLPFSVGSVRGAATIIMSGFGVIPAAGVAVGSTVYVANMTTATGITMVAGANKYLYLNLTYQI